MTGDQLLDALDALAPLAQLPRTGWVVRGCVPEESLAAHTFAVAALTALLVDALRAEGTAVDGEAALRMALFHDAAEARTGDVPMPMKSPALSAALHEVEAAVVASILPADAAASWLAAERDDSVEARLVRAADKLQMLAQALRFERAGASRALFDSMWAKPDNLRALELAPVRRLYAALFARAERTPPVAL